MPSGKASRQQRTARAAPPPVRSKGKPRQRQASPRVLIGAGVAALAIAIGVTAAVVLGGGSSSSLKNVPAVGTLTDGISQSGLVNSLFKGIPQTGNTLGRPGAPVTMLEFIDLQCPYCQAFETQVMPNLLSKYVRSGKLKIEMQPWAFIGPDSIRGQAAVLAAAKQNKAFNYAELLYYNQATENTGWLNSKMVTAVARSIPGLHVHTLLNQTNTSTIKSEQKQVNTLAIADKVTGTPTLFIGKSGTRGARVTLTSPTDEQAVVNAINAATG